MVRRWVCGVVVVAMIFGSLGWSAPAMPKQPSDYYVAEFAGGELGTIAGAYIGGYSKNQGVIVWGAALGASSGVALVGLMYGIDGNVLGAYIGPSLWAIAASGALVLRWYDLDLSFAVYSLFLPAILAVIGYNIGAKMKDTGQPASLPWSLDLPVLSLEF